MSDAEEMSPVPLNPSSDDTNPKGDDEWIELGVKAKDKITGFSDSRMTRLAVALIGLGFAGSLGAAWWFQAAEGMAPAALPSVAALGASLGMLIGGWIILAMEGR